MFHLCVISTLQVLLLVSSCEINPGYKKQMHQINKTENREPGNIKAIPLPEGFKHIHGTDSLFAEWLLSQHLRKEKQFTCIMEAGNKTSKYNLPYLILILERKT